MIERKQKHWVINKLYNSGWYIWNNSDLRKATNKSLVRVMRRESVSVGPTIKVQLDRDYLIIAFHGFQLLDATPGT